MVQGELRVTTYGVVTSCVLRTRAVYDGRGGSLVLEMPPVVGPPENVFAGFGMLAVEGSGGALYGVEDGRLVVLGETGLSFDVGPYTGQRLLRIRSTSNGTAFEASQDGAQYATGLTLPVSAPS